MSFFDDATIDLVAVIGAATIPSPARRCPLQFNPFLDPERARPFQVVAYNSQGKFQRVVMEGSSNNFPSELQFQKNMSVTTSGESGWDSNSQPSLSSGVNNIVSLSSRRSSALLGYRTLSFADDLIEKSFVPDINMEKATKETDGGLSQTFQCHSNAPREDMIASTTCTDIEASSESPRSVITIESSNVIKEDTVRERVQVNTNGKQEKQIKWLGTQAHRPHNESVQSTAKGVNKGPTASSTLVRKITPDLKEGLAMIKRRTQNASGNGTPKHKSNGTCPSDGLPGDVARNEGADKERDLSKKSSLRKLLPLGRGGSEDVPSKKNSLRNMLRKTSRTLRVNILDSGKPTEVDAGRARKRRETHVAAADDECQTVSKNKRSPLSSKAAPKRDVEKDYKADKSGSRSETACASSREMDNHFDKVFMQQAVHVEKYLDELAFP